MRGQSGVSRRTLCAALATAAIVPAAKLFATPRSPSITLVRGGTVLSMVPGTNPRLADIPIRGGAIEAIGASLAAPDGAHVIEAANQIVLPGFVDTHFHMWNSALRGLSYSAKGGFAPAMAAISRHFTPRDNALGVRLASVQALESGITTIHNWAHNIIGPAHAEAEWAAMADSGLRGRFAYRYARWISPI